MYDINYFYNESATKYKTRETIISSALDLFGKKGIENVSMMDISNSSLITSRNLYRYYSSKEFLVIDCTYFVFYKSYLEKAFQMNGHSGFDQLKNILNQFVESLMNKQNFFTTFIMYFDIYIAQIPKDHPAFIRYQNTYRPHIIESKDSYIKYSILKGIMDKSIKISNTEVDLHVNYITQSIFALASRINIKEYENEAINKTLLTKHIDVILKHLGEYNGN